MKSLNGHLSCLSNIQNWKKEMIYILAIRLFEFLSFFSQAITWWIENIRYRCLSIQQWIFSGTSLAWTKLWFPWMPVIELPVVQHHNKTKKKKIYFFSAGPLMWSIQGNHWVKHQQMIALPRKDVLSRQRYWQVHAGRTRRFKWN